MPDTLTSTIEDLRQGIKARKFRSEAEISQGVVGQILTMLEWPFHDTQVVAPQFKIGTRKVDYALCHPPGRPSVFLEVKDLGKADGKGEKQLFEYCFHHGVPIAVLTDGQIWNFFFPSGQGSYEERRFARIDLLIHDPGASSKTLIRYLQACDVRSGEARKRAESDYETTRKNREAAMNYPSVWRKLLSGPESLLLDLFMEEVQQATGIRPDPKHASEFIRAQTGTTTESPGESRKRRTVQEGDPIRETRYSFTFQGKTEYFNSGAEAFGRVFEKLASMDPEFCTRFSKQHFGRVRRYVARSKDLLYPGHPEREKQSHPLPGGWWLATHCKNSAKLDRVKNACKVAGLEFGKEVVVRIPSASHKKEGAP